MRKNQLVNMRINFVTVDIVNVVEMVVFDAIPATVNIIKSRGLKDL